LSLSTLQELFELVVILDILALSMYISPGKKAFLSESYISPFCNKIRVSSPQGIMKKLIAMGFYKKIINSAIIYNYHK